MNKDTRLQAQLFNLLVTYDAETGEAPSNFNQTKYGLPAVVKKLGAADQDLHKSTCSYHSPAAHACAPCPNHVYGSLALPLRRATFSPRVSSLPPPPHAAAHAEWSNHFARI